MCEDLFEKLESVLLGENRTQLDDIKNQFYQNLDLWHADMQILEKYYKDQEKENEVLMIEIEESNEQLKQLKEQILKMDSIVKNNDKILIILEKNNKRLKILKGKTKAIEEDKKKLQKSYAAKIGWIKHDHGEELNNTIKSYAAKLGWARKWHFDAIATLEEIQIESINKKFKNLDNFKTRIQNLCAKTIEICQTCNYPVSMCKCKDKE